MLPSTSAVARWCFVTAAGSRRLLHTTRVALIKERKERIVPAVDEVGWAFNHIEKKKGMYKPKHTVEEQIAYLQSRAFHDAYQGRPVWFWYRRNMKTQLAIQPPPRLICIDSDGRFTRNHPCPVCRDEYLFFDYRSPKLIEMFLREGTAEPIDILRSGLCREQYANLKAQLLKAKEHGTVTFGVEFRNFDYKQWYPWWEGEAHREVHRSNVQFEDVLPDPIVHFPSFKPLVVPNWTMWWLDHKKFAKLGK